MMTRLGNRMGDGDSSTSNSWIGGSVQEVGSTGEIIKQKSLEKCTSTFPGIISYIKQREMGVQSICKRNKLKEHGMEHMLQTGILRECEIPLDRLNKVFCSEWLSDNQIVFGTKCNKLMVLDIETHKIVQIPSLTSSKDSIPPESTCGIHALEVNPSHTLLATGSQNANDVAVYKLPTLDPICVGENAHKDWIFDLAWLDDEYFVSGSRDTSVALWRVKEDYNINGSSSRDIYPSHRIFSPISVKTCKNAEKVRAVLYNQQRQEFVALSLNGWLHLWDAHLFKQRQSFKLPFSQETVCMTQHYDHKVYVVGSRSHVTLLDTKTLKPIKNIASRYQGCGIRSLSFMGNLLTVGTGVGVLMFYDIRAGCYLEQKGSGRPGLLRATRGWVYPDEIFQEVFLSIEYNPAIYTHCYDSSGTKLFTAGGPLPAGLQGNYAGLWQ